MQLSCSLFPQMTRQRHTASFKLLVLEEVQRREDKESLRAIAHSFGLDPRQIRAWRAQTEQLKAVNSNACSVNLGRPSSLQGVQEDLLEWMFEQRECGFALSVRMVNLKAQALDNNFRRKSDRAKDQAIRRFLKAHRYSIRVGTHEAQRSPSEVRADALNFLVSLRPTLIEPGRSQHFILNMDQTPIFFSMTPRTTLNQIGARTVNIRSSSSSTMRVTVSVTVSSAGDMLRPLIVFKGKPNGRIAREFSNFPNTSAFACQERAWMDETVMIQWIQEVLHPYVSLAPNDVRPILLLDSFRCHMMTSVVNSIAQLGVEVRHIPGGCTGLVQPIDVGIGKPLKNRVRQKWEDWMISQGISISVLKPPSRELLTSWILESLKSLEPQLIRNSWLRTGLSYFE